MINYLTQKIKEEKQKHRRRSPSSDREKRKRRSLSSERGQRRKDSRSRSPPKYSRRK